MAELRTVHTLESYLRGQRRLHGHLTVTDAATQTASDTAVVTVANVAPTGSLSNNGPVNTNATVTISFSNQNDVSTPDRNAGYVYSYDCDNNGTWEQTDVTSATASTSFATAGTKTVKARIRQGRRVHRLTTTVIVNARRRQTLAWIRAGMKGRRCRSAELPAAVLAVDLPLELGMAVGRTLTYHTHLRTTAATR